MRDVQPLFVPYPALEQHGAIGNRRTAALVAADGTVDWLCLPDYDGTVAFGVLLDAERAGFFRLGPAGPSLGRQHYIDGSAMLVTSWSTADWELELLDFMESPQDERGDDANGRSLVRLLRCLRGRPRCRLDARPCYEFDRPAAATQHQDTVTFDLDAFQTVLWASLPLEVDGQTASTTLDLQPGEECAAAFCVGKLERPWSMERVQQALDQTLDYWRSWQGNLKVDGDHPERVRRSAATIHLMGYSPAGSSVAAPTTSLPERIGGERNYDYRFSWVRDASLSAGTLSLLGDTDTAARYMDWLAQLGSSTDAPLQVAYGVNGETVLKQEERRDMYGYRHSLPVRLGNHVYCQQQLGALGYLADCAYLYLLNGGEWKPEYWRLVRRIADYTAGHWRQQDHGIWELNAQTHHVSSKVMCWVTLDRAGKIAHMLDEAAGDDLWRETMDEIHAEVMDRGWSQELQSFRQSYGADTLDASELLIAIMDFLPPDHPRVRSTIEAIEQRLMIDGYLYRFDPHGTEGIDPLPLGEFEGSFVPSCFMLVCAYVKIGETAKAQALMDRMESVSAPLGLLPEEIDGRSGGFLGNLPLLFSHAEHIRAAVALAHGLQEETRKE